MDPRVQSFVGDALTASVTELFQSYGVPCGPAADPVEDGAERVELGSMIGFRGRGVRGGLAFVAPTHLIAKLLPVPPDPTRTDQQLRDWSAEIANQLVGRMKNKLSSKTIDFHVGTPVCFAGKSIHLVFLPGANGVSVSFLAANSPIQIHLDCTLSPELVDGEVEAVRIIPEGDILLF